MPAHGRPMDNYARRRAAEQRARRKAAQESAAPPPAPARPRSRPVPSYQAAARVILDAMEGLQDVPPITPVRNRWKHEHDVELLRLAAQGLSQREIAAQMRTRAVTTCQVESRILTIMRLYG